MVTKLTQSNHWATKKNNVIQSYWDSPPATKRSKWFVNQLNKYKFDHIFEVGFFSGRNLKYIGESFPDVKISGLEINKGAVKFAKERLPKANLLHMDLHNMDACPVSADIVFTSGVLIHVPPSELPGVCEKILKHANKYVMHIESVGNNEVTAGPKKLNPTYKVSDQVQWSPDLVKIYRSMGYYVSITQLPDECKTNGASELITIKL